MAQRIVDPRFKPALLFVIADFQPVLNQLDTSVYDEFFDLWTNFEEVAVLFFRAKPHDMLYASADVPTAVEEYDLAAAGKCSM